MSWTDPSDVLARWVGDDEPTEDSKIQVKIDDAEVLIRSEFSDIQARLDAESTGGDLLARIIFVVSQMVTRAFRNPEAATSRLDVAGPFTTNVSYGAGAQVSMWLTDDERELLAVGSTVSTGAAFTIDPTPFSSPLSASNPNADLWPVAVNGTWYDQPWDC